MSARPGNAKAAFHAKVAAPMPSAVLTLACPDQPGIVARVSTFLFESGANIIDAQQFDDKETGRFFMRVVFDAADLALIRDGFAPIARTFAMEWSLRDTAHRLKVMLLVSRFDHCLADLIYPLTGRPTSGFATIKAALSCLGLCEPYMAPPLTSCSPAEIEALRRVLSGPDALNAAHPVAAVA